MGSQEVSVEDVEVLLENVRYIDCERCLENIKLKRRLLNVDCPNCNAWGILPNPRYCEAAARAGLPVPPTAEEAGIARLEEIMGKERSLDHNTGDAIDALVYAITRGSV